MLLKQLLDVDNELINLSELAELLLSQADHVGTAVKCDGEETDPYAFISVINLHQHNDKDVVKSLIKYLSSRTAQNAKLKAALSDSAARIGLLLSERFINMPHQVVPPMYTMLQREMSLGGDAFRFTHLLLLSKTYAEIQSALDGEEKRPQKKQRASTSSETFFFHPEDEILHKHALVHDNYDYEKEADAGRSDSKRAFQDAGIKSQGHVILIEQSAFDNSVKAITEYLGAG